MPVSELYLKIRSTEGAEGLYGPVDKEAAFVVEQQLRPFLIGKDALAGEALGNGEPDALGCSRDDGNLPLERSHDVSFSWLAGPPGLYPWSGGALNEADRLESGAPRLAGLAGARTGTRTGQSSGDF